MSYALEKIIMLEVSGSICKTVYEDVLCDTCDPWYVVHISLFSINSYHKQYKKHKLRNKMGSDTEHYMSCALEKITMAEAICGICITVSEVVICSTCGLWSLKKI